MAVATGAVHLIFAIETSPINPEKKSEYNLPRMSRVWEKKVKPPYPYQSYHPIQQAPVKSVTRKWLDSIINHRCLFFFNVKIIWTTSSIMQSIPSHRQMTIGFQETDTKATDMAEVVAEVEEIITTLNRCTIRLRNTDLAFSSRYF